MKYIIWLSTICLFLVACNGPTQSPQAPVAPKKPEKLVRPPFPNMANALWGREVVKNLPKLEKPSKGHLGQWLQLWHEQVGGDAEALKREAWLYHQETIAVPEKNTALSLLAVSYCLDWSSTNYKERLVDAVGLISLSGEGGKENLLGQVARAYVLAKAGLVHQSEKIIAFLKTDQPETENVALMKAMTLDVLGQHDDRYLGHLTQTLNKKNNSARARWMKAKTLNKWGAHEEAITALPAPTGEATLLRFERVQAWIGQQKWQNAKKLLDFNEDQRAALSPTLLGQLNYLEAQTALALKDRKTFDARVAQLALSPYFRAEEKVLRAKGQTKIETIKEQAMPRVNRVPPHLRSSVLRLWLQWCVATQNKKLFKEASQKAPELGLDMGEVYVMEAELKKQLGLAMKDASAKNALRKESQYLLKEAKKVWPQGLNAKRGAWVLAVRRALLDDAKAWARNEINTKGKAWLKDPVMQGLLARTYENEAEAWEAALNGLKKSDRLATVDIKTLLGMSPKELSRADKIELELIAQKSSNVAVRSLIAARLQAQKEDHHDHEHGAHP